MRQVNFERDRHYGVNKLHWIGLFVYLFIHQWLCCNMRLPSTNLLPWSIYTKYRLQQDLLSQQRVLWEQNTLGIPLHPYFWLGFFTVLTLHLLLCVVQLVHMAICNVHSNLVDGLITTSLYLRYTGSLLLSTMDSNLHSSISVLEFPEFVYSVLSTST